MIVMLIDILSTFSGVATIYNMLQRLLAVESELFAFLSIIKRFQVVVHCLKNSITHQLAK